MFLLFFRLARWIKGYRDKTSDNSLKHEISCSALKLKETSGCDIRINPPAKITCTLSAFLKDIIARGSSRNIATESITITLPVDKELRQSSKVFPIFALAATREGSEATDVMRAEDRLGHGTLLISLTSARHQHHHLHRHYYPLDSHPSPTRTRIRAA